MKEQDLLQLKSEFSAFFKRIQKLINANDRFEELITDYIECKNTVEKLRKQTGRKPKQLLKEYLNIQKELESEIYYHLNNKKL